MQGKLFRIDRNTKGLGCFFHLSFTQTEVRLYIKRILKFSHLGWFFNVSAIFLFQFQDITDRLLQSMEASNQSVDNLLLEIDQSIAASRDTMRYAHNSDVKCPPHPSLFSAPPPPLPPPQLEPTSYVEPLANLPTLLLILLLLVLSYGRRLLIP